MQNVFPSVCLGSYQSLSDFKPQGFRQSHELEKKDSKWHIDVKINDTNSLNKSVQDFLQSQSFAAVGLGWNSELVFTDLKLFLLGSISFD